MRSVSTRAITRPERRIPNRSYQNMQKTLSSVWQQSFTKTALDDCQLTAAEPQL